MIDGQVGVLETKTIYQSSGVSDNIYTRFTSDVRVNNGLVDNIRLRQTGDADFAGNVQIDGDFNVDGATTLNTLTTSGAATLNTASTTADFTVGGDINVVGNHVNSLRFGANNQAYRDCGIDYTIAPLNPTSLNDMGSMMIRGTNLYIGNANQLTTITINGQMIFSSAQIFSFTSGSFLQLW